MGLGGHTPAVIVQAFEPCHRRLEVGTRSVAIAMGNKAWEAPDLIRVGRPLASVGDRRNLGRQKGTTDR